MADGRRLDIGLWFPRPERGATLAEELRHRGHRVMIYHHLPVPGDQSHVRRVDYSMVRGTRVLRRLTHDVLYTSGSFLPVLQLRFNRWQTGRPYVYVLNGAIWAYFDERHPGAALSRVWKPLYPKLLKLSLGGADAVVANSEFLARSIKTRFPEMAGKVSSIHNGVNFNAIDTATGRSDAWPNEGTRILSVVTLNFDRKAAGVHLLLDAFNTISRSRGDATYLIAAKSDNPDILREIREHLERLPCADRIRLDANRDDVPDLLAAADLFLYATPADSSDSLPRALLEAQAAGVPTVTTDTTGCPEAVLDGETGKVVKYDAESIADGGLELLQYPELATRLADAGRKSVRDRFSWKAMARAYEHTFLRISAAERARALKA